MCRMTIISAMVRLLVLVASLTLSLFMPNALVGLGIWFVVWLVWERVPADNRLGTPSLLELLPFAIAAQVALDAVVPYLGDAVVVVGNALIVAALRRPKLPPAHVHRVPTVADRRARVHRVMAAQAAAPAASACGGARPAS
jgi:hypothetical protein